MADLFDDPSADDYWSVCFVARSYPDLIPKLAEQLRGVGLPEKREGALDQACALAKKGKLQEAAHWMERAAYLRPLKAAGKLKKQTPSARQDRENRKAERAEVRRAGPSIRAAARGLL